MIYPVARHLLTGLFQGVLAGLMGMLVEVLVVEGLPGVYYL